MLTTKLRPFAGRISRISHTGATSKSTAKALASAYNIEIPTSVSSTPRRFITTEQETFFQERGFLDAQGMTAFNTLHELQVHSSHVFSKNELFGTYEEQSNTFKFMTYDEYNQKVNQCRSLLKDLGE